MLGIKGYAHQETEQSSGEAVKAGVLQEALRQEEACTAAGLGPSAAPCVQMQHFEAALPRIHPSVSPRDQFMYESLRQTLRRCALLQLHTLQSM